MRGSGRGMERERKTGQLEGSDERKGEVQVLMHNGPYPRLDPAAPLSRDKGPRGCRA